MAKDLKEIDRIKSKVTKGKELTQRELRTIVSHMGMKKYLNFACFMACANEELE